jgi:hypothetical protein
MKPGCAINCARGSWWISGLQSPQGRSGRRGLDVFETELPGVTFCGITCHLHRIWARPRKSPGQRVGIICEQILNIS